MNKFNYSLIKKDDYIKNKDIGKNYISKEEYQKLDNKYQSLENEYKSLEKELRATELGISKKYVPLEKYNDLINQLNTVNIKIKKFQSGLYENYLQHCNSFIVRRDNVIVRQENIERDIKQELSIYHRNGVFPNQKSEAEIKADLSSVEQKRKYSEQLNLQHAQLLSEHSKCLENAQKLLN